MSDKTEAPTPRRLRKAREEGDSGSSTYAAQAVAFIVVVALVPHAVRALASRASDELRAALAAVAALHGPPRFDPLELAMSVTSLTVPILLAAGIVGAAAQAIQTGGVVATKKLTPRLERLDPIAGFKRLFSAARLFAVARAILAGGVVGWLTYAALRDHLVAVARLVGRLRWIDGVVGEVAGGLAWRAALAGLAIGAADLGLTRITWMRKLRMSKDEVKREHRDAEGDPQLKAARERAHQELVAQTTIAEVRSASVVVVNPTHLACALRYDERAGDDAPVVVASGRGEHAAAIAQAALDYGIPVLRDVPLARVLVELAPGQAIPEALYDAVAEILREVWA
jgi:type III secretion protein U